MKSWSSTTRIIALTTSSLIRACWARRSSNGTGISGQRVLESADCSAVTVKSGHRRVRIQRTAGLAFTQGMMPLGLRPGRGERQRDVPAQARRLVDPEDQFERLPALAPIRLRLRLAAKHRQHVAVIAGVPEAIHAGRVRAYAGHELVVIVVVGERPVLDPVHGGAADLYGSPFA